MKRNAQGFTLIELIIVVVILGILAATAMPKFLDVADEASQAAADGVAGAITSASSVNYAARAAGKGTGLSAAAATICDETYASLAAIMAGGMPTGYTLEPTTGSTKTCSGDGYVECTVDEPKKHKTATARVTCAS